MSSDEDMKDMVGGCNVCCDEKGWEENPLVYCDGQGCNVAVHQACYGIVQVPSGPWYCRKCESQERSTRVRCDLCPSRDGALKRTDQNGWAHVVCALYIPEVRFGNVTTMEPILISLIPAERFGRSCYVCENANRGSKATTGACMQCNKPGCKQNFHVTCGQLQGLLCEEAGNMDNVKYCGYCQHHYAKLVRKAGRNVKIIPPFRPVPSRSTGIADSPGSSPDKSGRISPEESKLLISSNVLSRNNGTAGPGGDYIPAKKIGSSNSINADIDSSTNSKNSSSSKSSKKNGSSHLSSKSSDSSISSKSSSSSITPKIAQPVLAVATFSHHHHHQHHKNNKDGDEKPLIIDSKNRLGKDTESIKDDSFTVKFGVDNPLMKGSSVLPKKDFSTLQLKEVITDHPVSSSSKYDQGNNSSGVDSSISSSNAVVSTSGNSSSRHSQQHGDKTTTLLPDIKPHVTLTPIPMHMQGGSGSTANTSASSSIHDHEEKLTKDSIQNNNKNIKSPASSNNTISFHSTSFGHKMPESSGAETNNKRLSDTTHLDLSDKLEKSGPPSKRSRGASRDEDRGRKTPTKGRGGGRSSRGASNSSSSYHNRRDNYDENSREDTVLDIGNSGSTTTRGSRSGRKPGGSRLVGRPPADDPPAPTLSQLKSQMEAAAAASSDGTLGVLPTHMFGNALNPASSMAQRMVDTLSQEMEAVVAAGVSVPDTVAPPPPLVGISLPGKSSSTNGSVSGTSSSINAASSSANAPPQTLEQLLERQWQQGSQFLMEQAQHLDIAQLLSCLNQLKQDNKALEEHVQTLAQRRDQLVAINARLSIPLGNSSGLPAQFGNNALNGSSSAQAAQNGHGTPPLQTHSISGGPKGLQVNSSTPSPQQHEIVVQSGRQHGHRDERIYHSEMTVSRTEINISHPPVGSPHGLSRQNVAPYGYPGPNNHSAAGHHHPSQHGHGRGGDGSSR